MKRRKNRRIAHLEVVTAAEGLKATLYVSPSVLRYVANRWKDQMFRGPIPYQWTDDDNVSLQVDLHDLDGGHERWSLASLTFMPSPEEHTGTEAQDYRADVGDHLVSSPPNSV